jgi:hypothetical protein
MYVSVRFFHPACRKLQMCVLLVCAVIFDSSLVKVCVHPLAMLGQTFASTAYWESHRISGVAGCVYAAGGPLGWRRLIFMSFDFSVTGGVHHNHHKSCDVFQFHYIFWNTYHTVFFFCIIKRNRIYFCVKYTFLTGTNACSCQIPRAVSPASNLLLLSVHFILQSQTSIWVYWIEPIHSADMVSLFGRMVTANWLFLQAFLECLQPHHKHSSQGMILRSATLVALQSLHCGM